MINQFQTLNNQEFNISNIEQWSNDYQIPYEAKEQRIEELITENFDTQLNLENIQKIFMAGHKIGRTKDNILNKIIFNLKNPLIRLFLNSEELSDEFKQQILIKTTYEIDSLSKSESNRVRNLDYVELIRLTANLISENEMEQLVRFDSSLIRLIETDTFKEAFNSTQINLEYLITSLNKSLLLEKVKNYKFLNELLLENLTTEQKSAFMLNLIKCQTDILSTLDQTEFFTKFQLILKETPLDVQMKVYQAHHSQARKHESMLKNILTNSIIEQKNLECLRDDQSNNDLIPAILEKVYETNLPKETDSTFSDNLKLQQLVEQNQEEPFYQDLYEKWLNSKFIDSLNTIKVTSFNPISKNSTLVENILELFNLEFLNTEIQELVTAKIENLKQELVSKASSENLSQLLKITKYNAPEVFIQILQLWSNKIKEADKLNEIIIYKDYLSDQEFDENSKKQLAQKYLELILKENDILKFSYLEVNLAKKPVILLDYLEKEDQIRYMQKRIEAIVHLYELNNLFTLYPNFDFELVKKLFKEKYITLQSEYLSTQQYNPKIRNIAEIVRTENQISYSLSTFTDEFINKKNPADLLVSLLQSTFGNIDIRFLEEELVVSTTERINEIMNKKVQTTEFVKRKVRAFGLLGREKKPDLHSRFDADLHDKLLTLKTSTLWSNDLNFNFTSEELKNKEFRDQVILFLTN